MKLRRLQSSTVSFLASSSSLRRQWPRGLSFVVDGAPFEYELGVVPEPSTLALVTAGGALLLMLGAAGKRSNFLLTAGAGGL
jgi:hypothetical protein